jgi:peroxiredoxin
MTEIVLGINAQDFELNDFNGQIIRLSSYRGSKHIVLAFLRGFA